MIKNNDVPLGVQQAFAVVVVQESYFSEWAFAFQPLGEPSLE